MKLSMNKRTFVQTLLASSLATVALTSFAQTAATYPNKPIKIIVPFLAGGTTDILARAVAGELTKAWNASVIVENKPDASGGTRRTEGGRGGFSPHERIVLGLGSLCTRLSAHRLRWWIKWRHISRAS